MRLRWGGDRPARAVWCGAGPPPKDVMVGGGVGGWGCEMGEGRAPWQYALRRLTCPDAPTPPPYSPGPCPGLYRNTLPLESKPPRPRPKNGDTARLPSPPSVPKHHAPPSSLPDGSSRISSAGHSTAVREGPRTRPHKRVGTGRAVTKSRLLAGCDWPLRQHASPYLAIHSFLAILTLSARAHGIWTMAPRRYTSARGAKCCESWADRAAFRQNVAEVPEIRSEYAACPVF